MNERPHDQALKLYQLLENLRSEEEVRFASRRAMSAIPDCVDDLAACDLAIARARRGKHVASMLIKAWYADHDARAHANIVQEACIEERFSSLKRH